MRFRFFKQQCSFIATAFFLLLSSTAFSQQKGDPGPQAVPGLYAVGTIPPTMPVPTPEPDYAPDLGNEFAVYPLPPAADSAHRWEYLRIETTLQEVPMPDGSTQLQERPIYSTSKELNGKQVHVMMQEKGGLLGLMSILSTKRWQLAQVVYSPIDLPQRTTYFFKRTLK